MYHTDDPSASGKSNAANGFQRTMRPISVTPLYTLGKLPRRMRIPLRELFAVLCRWRHPLCSQIVPPRACPL